MNADDFNSLILDTWKDLHDTRFQWQVAALVGCLLVAWVVAYAAQRAMRKRAKRYVAINPERNAALLETRFGGLEQLVWPFAAWCLLVGADRVLHAYRQPSHMVRIAATLAID